VIPTNITIVVVAVLHGQRFVAISIYPQNVGRGNHIQVREDHLKYQSIINKMMRDSQVR
jgi:hypothetical protein